MANADRVLHFFLATLAARNRMPQYQIRTYFIIRLRRICHSRVIIFHGYVDLIIYLPRAMNKSAVFMLFGPKRI